MQSIWKKSTDLDRINDLSKNTLVGNLGIEFIEVTEDSVSATMPVDSRTYQPLGLLHGGASVVLAESLGSLAANLAINEDQYCLGLEINANHIRSVRSGTVTGTAKPVHLGKRTHVWDIAIVNEERQLVCTSRLTLAVI